MSETTTPFSARQLRYVAEHTVGDDAFLIRLKRAARAAGIPSIWIAPEQASLMQILLRLARAREVVEVGTLAGYSAIVMARALPPDGRVRTIEINPERAAFAESWIGRSDVAGKVEVLCGSGEEMLSRIAANSADATFLDADKSGYPIYLEHSMRILKPGGFVMVDNAFAFGQLLDEAPTDREVSAVRAFNEVMADEARLHSVIVPIGDGLWIGVKR